MENEINLNSGGLSLNVFPNENRFDSNLLSLVERNLHVLSRRLSYLLKSEFDSVEANLNIVSNHEIKKLNTEYRNKNKATDVLSFPLQENPRRGEFDDFDGHLELGDIFIAVGVCQAQALDNDISFDQEFVHLFTHGFLHLCGYDHEESEAEDQIMRGLEDEIMEELAAKKDQ